MASISSNQADVTNVTKNTPLKFVQFNSSIHPSFWSELENKKLNSWRLSTEPRVIYGSYEPASLKDLPPTLYVSSGSFVKPENVKKKHIAAQGILYLVNTLDEFKQLDKKTILKEASEKILSTCEDTNTTPMYTFVLLVHADVKKHKYIYWFGFPAWVSTSKATTTTMVEKSRKLTKSEKEVIIKLIENGKNNAALSPMYILHKDEILSIQTDDAKIKKMTSKTSWEALHTKLIFLDPSSSEKNPGWPLRVFLRIPNQRYNLQIQKMDVYCLRGDVIDLC